MSVQNGERLVTKQDLADFYDGILPYLGGMPEVLANKFSKGDIYSTDEKMIGQWYDGKPLYQRVIITTSTISMTANTWFTSSISIPNIETIVGGCIIDENGNKGDIWIGHNANTLLLLSSRTNDWVANAKIIVQYTKSSDTAISIGSDTDYSTEEKIVGTWIGGKPIYSRTYTGTTPSTVSSSTSLQVPMGASIERVIDAKAVFFNSNGTHYVGTLVATMDMDKGIRFNFQSNSHPTVPNVYEIFCTQESWCNLTYYLTVFYTKTTD